MPDKDAGTPRVFIMRHGETIWSQTGAYTGKTELILTAHGEDQVRGTGQVLLGSGKLINSSCLAHVYASPRRRAQQSLGLLFGGNDLKQWRESMEQRSQITVTEDIAEWDYGSYEGLTTKQIREQRKSRELDNDRDWNIWMDGCEQGETPSQVTQRLDNVIQQIRSLQAPYMQGGQAADVLVVAHGHILRAFTKRWLGLPLAAPLSMMLEPGAIGILSYQHHSLDEPAFLLGMSIPPNKN